MNYNNLIRILRFLFVLIAQIVILNQIHVMGCITPLILGYMLICFRRGSSRIGLLFWGFLLGLVFDLFTNTPGMGAAACTFLAMLQPSLLSLFMPRDAAEDYAPTITNLGFWNFFLYSFMSMLIIHAVFNALNAFSLGDWQLTLIAIGGGTVAATVLSVFIELLVRSKQ